MAYQLDFEKLISFDDTGDGIALEAEIRYSDVSVRINARIDTGALIRFLSGVTAKI